MFRGTELGGPSTVRSNALWSLVTWEPCGQTDRQTRLETLPSCNFVGGRKKNNCKIVPPSFVSIFAELRVAMMFKLFLIF